MNLKELRKSKGLSQVDASLFLNIPLRTYKRIETENKYKNSLKYKDAFDRLKDYRSNKIASRRINNIIVVGAGYVGFSLAVLFSSSKNNRVTVIDIDETKVSKIQRRKPLFRDLDIEFYLENKALNLNASLPNKEIYKTAKYVIVATPTNFDPVTSMFDMSNVTNTINDIRDVNKDCLVIIKSTCYVGYTKSLNDDNIVFSPEFLREGKALRDNLFPSRVIIGGTKSKKVTDFVNLLTSYSKNNPQVLFMDSDDAEAVKLFSNAYLAMRVSYFNELDSFANKYNLDSSNIINGVSLDPRIGDYYNNPSFGYGGYCLPKDTLQLISQMDGLVNSDLIRSINRSNDSRKDEIVNDIISKLKKGGTVGIYSFASKEGSDSVRSSAIQDVMNRLSKRGVSILIYQNMSLDEFIDRSDLILANRLSSELKKAKEKVYTRDLFNRD